MQGSSISSGTESLPKSAIDHNKLCVEARSCSDQNPFGFFTALRCAACQALAVHNCACAGFQTDQWDLTIHKGLYFESTQARVLLTQVQLKLLGSQIVHLVAHAPEKTAEMPTTASKENSDRLRSFKNKGKDQDVSLRASNNQAHLWKNCVVRLYWYQYYRY